MNKEETLELKEYIGSAHDLADEFNIQVFRVNTQEFNDKVLLYYYRQVKEIDYLQQENQELKEKFKATNKGLKKTVEKRKKWRTKYLIERKKNKQLRQENQELKDRIQILTEKIKKTIKLNKQFVRIENCSNYVIKILGVENNESKNNK